MGDLEPILRNLDGEPKGDLDPLLEEDLFLIDENLPTGDFELPLNGDLESLLTGDLLDLL